MNGSFECIVSLCGVTVEEEEVEEEQGRSRGIGKRPIKVGKGRVKR